MVEIKFLDHVEVSDTDIETPSKHKPIHCTVRGRVIHMGKMEGQGFVEVSLWEGQGDNSKTAIVLLDTVLSERVLK